MKTLKIQNDLGNHRKCHYLWSSCTQVFQLFILSLSPATFFPEIFLSFSKNEKMFPVSVLTLQLLTP